jgi:hypothetical protein
VYIYASALDAAAPTVFMVQLQSCLVDTFLCNIGTSLLNYMASPQRRSVVQLIHYVRSLQSSYFMTKTKQPSYVIFINLGAGQCPGKNALKQK